MSARHHDPPGKQPPKLLTLVRRAARAQQKSLHTELTWPVDLFLQRLLHHVPPHNYRTLRSCGLYAPNAAEKRQRARAALDQAPVTEGSTQKATDVPDHDSCEVCGKKLVLVAKIPRPRPRAPPRNKRTSTRRHQP